MAQPRPRSGLAGERPWFAEFTVSVRRETFRGYLLGSSTFSFESPTSFTIGWASDAVLEWRGARLPMLATICGCLPLVKGGFLVTARPFALAGEGLATWSDIVAQTRPAGTPTRLVTGNARLRTSLIR